MYLAIITSLIIILAIFYYKKNTIHNTKWVYSNVDGMYYKVHQNHKETEQEAADIMAHINQRLIEILRHLRDNYHSDDAEKNLFIKKLLKRYNFDNMVENSPVNPKKDTSYVINKGSVFALCLRDKKTNKLHDLDTLTFVALHEMTHIALEDIDHPKEFWVYFKFLLQEAENAGIYVSIDYTKFHKKYCGMVIEYNPVYDTSL